MKVTENDFQSFLRNATEIGIERKSFTQIHVNEPLWLQSRYGCKAVMAAKPLWLQSRYNCKKTLEIDNLKNNTSVLSID
jgi:hypothetical protein